MYLSSHCNTDFNFFNFRIRYELLNLAGYNHNASMVAFNNSSGWASHQPVLSKFNLYANESDSL